MTTSRPIQVEVEDKETLQMLTLYTPRSAESQLLSQDTDPNIGISQSHPMDPGPNDVAMLRVLFQAKRTLPATESDTPLVQSPSTQSLDDGSANLPRDVEIDQLRDELREAKVKLIQANNDQKRLRYTVKSLEKELANVYTNVQSELGIWEKELLELRPMRGEMQVLRLASYSSGIKIGGLEKENRNLRAELRNLKKETLKRAGQEGGADLTASSNASAAAIPIRDVSPLRTSSPLVDNSESKISILDTFLELEDSSTATLPGSGPAAFVSKAGKIVGVPSSVYPEGIHAPRADLIIGAGHGFFRYDHKFLMQFQSPCKDIPSEASRNFSRAVIQADTMTPPKPRKKKSKNAASVKQIKI